MIAGPLLFARYAYPPNSLGYCGADATRTLLEYGDARASDGGLAELARTFEGAWPYLTLIAHANEIADPLDPRVVQAYWVGNELLDRVEPGDWQDTSTRASAVASVGRPSAWSTRSPQERLPTTPSTSSRSTRGSGCCERESSRSRCTSSTAAGSRPHGFAPSRATKPSSTYDRFAGTSGHSSSERGRPGTSAGAKTGSRSSRRSPASGCPSTGISCATG